MNSEADSTIELEYVKLKHGQWLTLWFNQPRIRNPLTDRMRVDLLEALDRIRDDRSVRGITLRGRGGIFCAGGDLKAFKSLASGEQSRKSIMDTSADIGQLLAAVNTMPQVVVALIEGAAMAGGFGLACCADVVICEKDAKFAMTETAIGLSPAQIAPYAIQKLGYATARRLMVTGARFTGVEASEFGFADFIGANTSELEALEENIRRSTVRCAPGAIADTKSLLHGLRSIEPDSMIEYASANFADRVQSAEALEGISSFFEKRKPQWAD